MTGLQRTGIAVAAAVALTLIATPPAAPRSDMKSAPVVKVRNSRFGYILQNHKKRPLYYWRREKRAGGKIRCTGACARAWPPLTVRSRKAVPRRIPHVRGRFGVVRRPDGRLQVTFRGLPLYAYHGDPPNTVLCNNVNGWFVVRV